MPKPNKIQTEPALPEKTQSELEMEALVKGFDGALTDMSIANTSLFTQIWGTPDRPRDKAEVEALLNADPIAAHRFFVTDAALKQALGSNGAQALTLEPWELVPARAASFAEDGSITLADDLAQEWVDAAIPAIEEGGEAGA